MDYNTPISALARALPAGITGANGQGWVKQLDPFEAWCVLAIALLTLGAIPATSKFALWAGIGIFLLLLITARLGAQKVS